MREKERERARARACVCVCVCVCERVFVASGGERGDVFIQFVFLLCCYYCLLLYYLNLLSTVPQVGLYVAGDGRGVRLRLACVCS
jgi:hypothetical protein